MGRLAKLERFVVGLYDFKKPIFNNKDGKDFNLFCKGLDCV